MIDSNEYAISGLGVTDQGRLPGRTDIDIKTEALQLAIADAGLLPVDIDGYIFQPGMSDIAAYGHGGEVVKALGMNPNFVWTVQAGGTSTIGAIIMALGAIESGQATTVAIGYGDCSLTNTVVVGQAGAVGGGDSAEYDTNGSYGMYSPGADHALAARRHMHVFGTTKEQLGAIATTTRSYANLRPDAYLHNRPLSLDEYMESRMIADPLGRNDYCLVADGGCAFIVTKADKAKDLAVPPVLISGLGSSLSLGAVYERTQYENLGVARARDQTFGMAGMTPDDIDVAQLYDCFTITVLMALEGYGFCKPGEGGPFAEDGHLGPDGRLPTNTAGGELAWSYQQGFTPVVEGIRQMRGLSGPTQLPNAERCLVTGHGGVMATLGHMDYAESAMILSSGSA